MFYANFVLAKKGPLARVWLAAHWEKKLSKSHVFETDLQASIESIICPKVKIALRTSGHLLLGVVRIYSRKAKYLLADCTEALIKIKMAFRPDVVDLPLDNQKAAISAITLPEFQEWDAMMNNMGKFDVTVTLQNNQCRVEEITMKEDLFSSRYLTNDNFFGDTPFGETDDGEIMREGVVYGALESDLSRTTIDDSKIQDQNSLSVNQSNIELAMNDETMEDVGFGAGEGLDFLEDFGLGDVQEVTGLEELVKEAPLLDELDETLTKESEDKELEEADKAVADAVAEMINDQPTIDFETEAETTEAETTESIVQEQPTELVSGMETTLFSRDTEAIALEPVEITVGKEKRRKRKRKLIVDDTKIISSDQMKNQIENHNDIVKAAVVAPTTRWRMSITDTTVKMLFDRPTSFQTKKRRLNALYKENQTKKIPEDLILPSSQEDDDDVQLEDPSEILREAEDTTIAVPELTKDITELENDDEQEEEFLPTEDVEQMDVDMEVPLDDNVEDDEEEIQVPPPFQLDVTETIVNINASELNNTEDEEVEEETDKNDAQDKRWTKRTQQTLHLLEKAMKKKEPVNFKDLTKKCNRKQAAYKFYTLLTLNKEKCITVEQDGIFADILISRGERFGNYA